VSEALARAWEDSSSRLSPASYQGLDEDPLSRKGLGNYVYGLPDDPAVGTHDQPYLVVYVPLPGDVGLIGVEEDT